MSEINTLSIFFLNMWGNKSFVSNQKQVLDYIANLCKFAEFYLKQRYDMTVEVHDYWPYATPKTYADVQKYDAQGWLDAYFGKQLQMYCGYGLQLRPHEDLIPNAVGYCECASGGEMQLQVADMTYAEMPAYATGGFFGNNIYSFYSEFSRTFFHELDHQIGRLLLADWWLSGVHKAAKLPLEYYAISAHCEIGQVSASLMQNRLGIPVFAVQQDPRKV